MGDFSKREEALLAKKIRMFDEGKMQMWDLAPEDAKANDARKLKADKAFTLPMMLHKASRAVRP